METAVKASVTRNKKTLRLQVFPFYLRKNY